jgi:hypothetical protein
MAQRQFEGLINKEGATVDGPRLRVSGDPRLDISIESQGSNVDKPALRFFADLWRSELEPIYQSAVAQVADFLLSDSEKSGPQGFGVSIQGWTTSWELFMDESAISLEGRDQALMRTALAATTAELSDMVSELGTGNAFFNFEPYLGLNLEGLLPTLVARHSNRDWGMSSWQGSYNWPQTIVKLLRQVYFSKRMTWDFRDEFHRSMKLAVELNPNLAIQLEWVFLDPNRPIDWFGPDEELSPTSGIIREMFRDCYSLNIDDLVAKLKIRWALKQLCFGLNSRNDPKDPELKDVPPWCASMFQSIIQAMEVSDLVRHNMIPQMAHIFVGDNRVFRDDLAKLLLGDTKPLFEMVLLEDEPNIEVDPVMGILYRTASLASKQPNGSK